MPPPVFPDFTASPCAVSTDFGDPVPRRRTPHCDTRIDWKALTGG